MTRSIFFRSGTLALLLTGILAVSLTAQESLNPRAFSSPDGNVIFFGTNALLHPEAPLGPRGWIGCNVYRKAEGETEFRKLNDRPVSRPGDLKDAERTFAHELDLVALSLRLSSREEVWKMFEANEPKALKMTIFDTRLQEKLGLLYRDREVREGVSYEYHVLLVDAEGRESVRGETARVIYGSPDFAGLGPNDVQVLGTEGRAEITWKANPEDRGAFGYHVYRSVDSTGRYMRLNLRPIILIGDPSSTEPAEGSFIDTGLIDGHVYWYAVVSCDLVGNESRRRIVPGASGDAVPPQAPGPLQTESSALGILVSWVRPQEGDIAGYHIYRSTNPDSPFVQINDGIVPATDTIYEDRKAGANRQYFYRVVAVDRAGNRSEESAYQIGYYRNFRPPLPPQYVEAVGNEKGVLISWERNEEEDLQGYYVYRAEHLDGELVQVSPLLDKETTTFQDTGSSLSSKGTYWYLVQGINLSGSLSRFSIPTAARPMLPELPLPPQTFHGYSESYGNRIFWSGLGDNTIVGVNIYRSPAPESSGRWERLNGEPVPAPYGRFTDSTARQDVEYVYTIRSVNDRGLESEPTQTLSLERASYPLLSPANLMVTTADRGVKLAWSAPFDRRVTGYVIYRKTGREKEERVSNGVISGTTFTDPSAVKGKTYLYSVATVSAEGTESGDRAQMVFEVW